MVFEQTVGTRLGDCTSVAMEEARWWMGCQPHIRILRGVVRSRIEIGAIEAPLHKCVALYMADIQEHSALEDEKVLLTIAGNACPSSSNSAIQTHYRFLEFAI